MQTPEELAQQQQFLNVIDRDTAANRFESNLSLQPLGTEMVALADALNRVLAIDVRSEVDVPGFDRSNVDGFAVQASDTADAMEETPSRLKLNPEVLASGTRSHAPVSAGTATIVATGGMIPRGANAVVMVEHTDVETAVQSDQPAVLIVRQSVAPGKSITFAGTDIAMGETVLRAGLRLTSREIGVLAAIGRDRVNVFRKPRVAIVSTGDEIVAPGQPLPVGGVYDSNASIVSAAVEELGCEPIQMGIVHDDLDQLERIVDESLQYDAVILSGGTSKGAGDLSYRVVANLSDPGIVAHGVALKPGKPICLAVTRKKPVVVLPGFPTSAIFTFHEFVAPVLRAFAGLKPGQRDTTSATMAVRVNSERGRTEFVLVGLVETNDGLTAYPMGKGSGSVTTFSLADGFLTIDAHTEIIEEQTPVQIQLLGNRIEPADLVVIGSHCVGLDMLLSELHSQGYSTKVMHVGSMGGLAAAKRGECDVAGVHLLDPDSKEYNTPFLNDELELVKAYRRMQGIVYRKNDIRFEGKSVDEIVTAVSDDRDCVMVNRNPGSGTRILTDNLLEGRQPAGYSVQTNSHNAVASAVAQSRADWGLAIETVAKQYSLGFVPIQEEQYDFVVPKNRRQRPAVQALCQLLQNEQIRSRLDSLGFPL